MSDNPVLPAEKVRITTDITIAVSCWTCDPDGVLLGIRDTFVEAQKLRVGHIAERHSDGRDRLMKERSDHTIQSPPPADCVHCWHGVRQLLSMPPIPVERCCWCGEEHQGHRSEPAPPHGPYQFNEKAHR